MTQTIELEKMGLTSLTDLEAIYIDGDGDGFWYDASYVITNGIRSVWNHMCYVSALSRG